MNILIVKLSAIGDVVQTLPFLDALRRAYPQARLTWLVEEAASGILLGHPALDRVLVSRRKAWTKRLKHGDVRAVWSEWRAFWKALRAEEYDLVVDLQGLFKSGILTYLSGGRRRVGFDRTREFSYLFVNERLKPYDPDRHAVLRYLDVAEYITGESVPEVRFNVPVDGAAAERARTLVADIGAPRVVINPGAKWVTKLWPTESWAELGRRLAGPLKTPIILTGSPDERPVNQEIGRSIDGVVDLTGRTDLKVLAELFRGADLVVCPDTGPMHLAVAVGTPVVALFGPTAPWRTGPFGPGHVVLRTGISCSPCFRKSCADPTCMTGLTPTDVYRTVIEKLETLGFDL